MEEILYWSRAIERFLIVGFGGVSLILGWSLFKTGITTKQEAEAKVGKWFIKLQKVGPGIFFALFGTIIMISSLSNPLRLNEDNPKKPGKSVSYIFRLSGSDQEQFIKAVNTIKFSPVFDPHPQLSDDDKKILQEAIQVLEISKARVLEQMYPDDFSRFMKIRNRSISDPNVINNLDESERKKYNEIAGIYNANFGGD